VAVDQAGIVYIADGANHRIRKVALNGVITTLTAAVDFPTSMTVSPAGVVHFVDGPRVRRVTAAGVVQNVAGSTEFGFAGDGGPATAALLSNPNGIAFDPIGNLYISDIGTNRVRRVGTDGIIRTIAGGGPFRSDPVITNTQINPVSVAADARGNVYIAERGHLIRIVNSQGIARVAVGMFNDTTFGSVGAPWGFSGDGGPALEAVLYEPVSIALDAAGNLYIADNRNERIRKVTPIPTPNTPAGLDAFSAYSPHVIGSYGRHIATGDITGDISGELHMLVRVSFFCESARHERVSCGACGPLHHAKSRAGAAAPHHRR
jgi:hypothetical protein